MAEQNDRPLRGSGFNTDPQTGDWDQLSFENHNLNEYVRGENTDTDDAFAIYVQGVSQTTKVFNVLKTGAVWTGSQNMAGLSASVNITFAAAAAAGTGTAALRSDATLLLYDGTNPEPVGSVATTGSSSLAPRRDHVHAGVTSLAASGNSALLGAVRLYAGSGVALTQIADGIQITASTSAAISATAGVPSLFFGTQNVAGTSGNYLDAASEVLVYDGTMPSTESIGGSAATGTATTAARRDHGHAITNTNVTLLGGSWGSGPTLTNPQIAATGWASANHAHTAGNSGGALSYQGSGQAKISVINASASYALTSYANIHASLNVTLVTTGGNVKLDLSMVGYNQTANQGVFWQLLDNGTALSTPPHGVHYDSAGSNPNVISIQHMTVATTATTHIYNVQWKVDGGTANNGGYEMRFIAEELPH